MFITQDLKMKDGYVYILSNKHRTVLYIGMTSNLIQRIEEHRNKKYINSFTAKFNCTDLIYYEHFGRIDEAIKREKNIKKWKRDWKLRLIKEVNPDMNDLLEDLKNGIHLHDQ